MNANIEFKWILHDPEFLKSLIDEILIRLEICNVDSLISALSQHYLYYLLYHENEKLWKAEKFRRLFECEHNFNGHT